MTQSRVLIVDDDAEMREALGLFLSGQGHDCEFAADAAAALGVVERQNLDAVVCDVRMEGMNGLELLDRVKRTHPELPFVIITAVGAISDAVDAIKRGAFEYVTKPCDLDELRKAVMGAIEERRRHESLDGFQGHLPVTTLSMELIGNGPAMRSLQSCIDFVAASSAPVIVTGETGVGKELVARAIHARGARRNRPFVAVNTSAIPQDLLEGEIFGHVRGAFTGAIQARRGLLTEADGGTLLLDEIGDMPAVLQPKLLRVLQFGDVRPVGSDKTHHVDVRVIAATHRDLPALVHEGRFREDLYFRLNVLPVFVPPLRDRREDIPALAAHFLAEACQRAPHSAVRSIGPDALRTLMEAPWPGNVRELATVIERAVVFGADLNVVQHGVSSSPHAAPGLPAVSAGMAGAFPSQPAGTLRNLSRAYTDWVLVQTGGNKERAAEILGIDLSTLYRWQRARQD
jgi:two-component system response regulator HydG